MKLQEVKRKHELAVSEDFAKYLSTDGETFQVVETPDPPDAILESEHGSKIWVEISDIFRSPEEARQEYSYAAEDVVTYTRPPQVMFEPDTKITLATIERVEKKIHKQSYSNVLDSLGKGYLVLWVYDPLFDGSTLDRVNESFKGETLVSDYFIEVFINYQMPNTTERVFTNILN